MDGCRFGTSVGTLCLVVASSGCVDGPWEDRVDLRTKVSDDGSTAGVTIIRYRERDVNEPFGDEGTTETCCRTYEVRTVDIATGAESVLVPETEKPTSIRYLMRDAGYDIVTDEDGTVQIWQPDGRVVAWRTGALGGVIPSVPSPSGELIAEVETPAPCESIALGCPGTAVHVYDAFDHSEVAVLPLPPGWREFASSDLWLLRWVSSDAVVLGRFVMGLDGSLEELDDDRACTIDTTSGNTSADGLFARASMEGDRLIIETETDPSVTWATDCGALLSAP